MKSVLLKVIIILGLVTAISCNDQNTIVKANEPPKVIKTSAPKEPDWILKKKAAVLIFIL